MCPFPVLVCIYSSHIYQHWDKREPPLWQWDICFWIEEKTRCRTLCCFLVNATLHLILLFFRETKEELPLGLFSTTLVSALSIPIWQHMLKTLSAATRTIKIYVHAWLSTYWNTPHSLLSSMSEYNFFFKGHDFNSHVLTHLLCLHCVLELIIVC